MNTNRREFIKKMGFCTIVTTIPAKFLHAVEPGIKQLVTPDSTPFDWTPDSVTQPIGIARGIYPGRVAWSHAPGAAHWNGNWESMHSPWWLDENTNQELVTKMVKDVILQVTGEKNSNNAWKSIFRFHNSKLGKKNKEYQKGEVVAVKINMNSTNQPERTNNYTDVSPQTIHALIEQLVKYAGVPEENILVYDGKRYIYSAVLKKVWADFKDVRFMQEKIFTDEQKHPIYADHRRMEQPEWVKAIQYSNGIAYEMATNIPKQVKEATYIVNLAMLKCHSYPYSNMEKGDEGQTAITMTGKNHFGSIQAPSELHAVMNTNRDAKPNTYSPLVDLAASSCLGKKTIFFMLDGLYSARKHSSYAVHFPNAPFFNKTYPYANQEWPSCVLASLDGVALDSVGLDILYSQTKNNLDPDNQNRPWMLIRENADDYLHEMALAHNPPSGVKYMQDNKQVTSLGVHEHWDNDETRRYSRNIDQKNGKGIELIYRKLS